MANCNPYFGLSLVWLKAEHEKWLAAHSALAAGQSYSLSADGYNKNLTRVDLNMVKETMYELKREIDRQTENERPRCTYPTF